MGFSDRYGLYCGLESEQAVMSAVRERQGRRKWERGGHVIQCSAFGFTK